MGHKLLWLLLGAILVGGSISRGQRIEITNLPEPGLPGQVTGNVVGIDPGTHEVAVYLHVEGSGWWTKPTAAAPTVPINSDGTFVANIGTGGLDEYASIFATSVVPIGNAPPILLGSNELDLGASSLTSAHRTRYGASLNFAGRAWGIKESPVRVGPGNNRFSSDPNDVWVDHDGLHLTINPNGNEWKSTEVVLTENLGYGTYTFQTNSRLDVLDRNAILGAFTWDPFGDDHRIPNSSNREIDFEDSRWGVDQTNNSQFVVQPYDVPGNIHRFELPDQSQNAALTRILNWSPGRIEFIAIQGHYSSFNYPASAVIDSWVYEEDLANGNFVPLPGRENFRFNLWLNRPSPIENQPVEVVINHFSYISNGDFDSDGEFDIDDVDSLVAEIATMSHEANFDLTGDGLVDDTDLAAWLETAGASNLASGNPYLVGDANLDGVVDGRDFLVWNDNKFSLTPAWSRGDFTADGMVDGRDFVAWNDNKFTSSNGVVPVPETEFGVSLMMLLSIYWLSSRFR